MSVDMTDSFIKMDIKTDQWQEQVINAFEGVDKGADVPAQETSDYNTKGMQLSPDELAGKIKAANANGLVLTGDGKAVKVDGSAFLYVNEQFSMKQQNQAGGLASASTLDKQINAKLSQKL